ncbi:MAG: cobalt-precorrin-5B (C(1))-methyltransferase [Flavobacteriales bacterium]
MSELQPPPKDKDLKYGYTTGACATAATRAALKALLDQKKIKETTITLMNGEKAKFSVHHCSFDHHSADCTVIKDAGDDPDVTHNAEIGSMVNFNKEKSIRFLQGDGVGKVTMKGMEILPGEPAINPVPRKMMRKEVNAVLNEHKIKRGVDIKIHVKNGAKIAKKTLNERLGIVGGISILGTTGIVTPYSASSYIASIEQGIDIALNNNCNELVLNSGGRSEKFIKSEFTDHPNHAFIQYGNWIGETLDKIRNTQNIKKVNIAVMLGKAVKIAEGNLDTSSRKNTMNNKFIVDIANEAGYKEEIIEQLTDIKMARSLTEHFSFHMDNPFFQKLAEKCFNTCKKELPSRIELSLALVDMEGKMIWYFK